MTGGPGGDDMTPAQVPGTDRRRIVDPRALVGLVVWYGLYQAVHLVFNAAYLLEPADVPFPDPAGCGCRKLGRGI